MAELGPKLLTDEVAARCLEVDSRVLMIREQMVLQQTDKRIDSFRLNFRVSQLIVIGVDSQRTFLIDIRVSCEMLVGDAGRGRRDSPLTSW